jgi:hypothetical protein
MEIGDKVKWRMSEYGEDEVGVVIGMDKRGGEVSIGYYDGYSIWAPMHEVHTVAWATYTED